MMLLVACHKPEKQVVLKNELEHSKLLSQLRSVSTVPQSNLKVVPLITNNPFNWVGVEHNNSLAYLNAKIDFTNNTPVTISVKQPLSSQTTNVFCQNVNDKMKTLLQKYWNEQAIPNNMTNEEVASISPKYNNNSQRVMGDEMLEFLTANKLKNPITYGERAFIQSAYQKMMLLANQGKITSFEVHADSILLSNVVLAEDLVLAQNTIINFENIIISSDLPQVVKNRQLCHAAVFRHSLAYWDGVANNPNNNWHNRKGMATLIPNNSTARLPRWLKKLCISFCGGVGGMMGGTLGPIGAGVGGALASAFADGQLG